MEVENFKEMLEAQLERVIEHGDMESSHKLPEESPNKEGKERSKVPHFSTPSKALLSRSQVRTGDKVKHQYLIPTLFWLAPLAAELSPFQA